jgi:hypothetical protein
VKKEPKKGENWRELQVSDSDGRRSGAGDVTITTLQNPVNRERRSSATHLKSHQRHQICKPLWGS